LTWAIHPVFGMKPWWRCTNFRISASVAISFPPRSSLTAWGTY